MGKILLVIVKVWQTKDDEIGTNEVSTFGGGSSFDKLKYNNMASLMSTEKRWKTFYKDQYFINLFKNKDLIEFSKRIFKFDEELENYITTTIEPNTSLLRTYIEQARCKILLPIASYIRTSRISANESKLSLQKSP